MKRNTPCLLAFVLLLLCAGNALAQTAAPTGKSFVQSANEERLYQVTVYSAKPELWSEALQFIKNEVVPANVKGGRKHMEVWTSVYGQSYESWFILPLENFAALDKADDVLLNGLGSREAVTAFWNKARSLNNSVRQFVIRVRPDLSYIKANAPTPKLASFTMTEIAYGREREVVDWMKAEMLPPLKKSDSYGVIRAALSYGETTGHLVITPHEKFAELDQLNPLTRVLGEEGVRKVMAKMPPGAITKLERHTLLFRPDLSILPK
ncbi:MAG: hypothetical protein HYR56_33055 [Acidobacteria bacterium]|nr:hypothetical protein [Acidobacteriota bacterium]MBI3422110.1 hypothetical protein [Acidobacteriota bacterium]